jgi:hypothetical protein
MAQTSSSEIKIKNLTQVGIVVEDVEKVAENYWNILGIGPWEILTFPPPYMYNRRYHGKPAYYVLKVALAKVGAIELELMQTVEGHSIYDDFFAEHGAGANHVQYLCDTAEEIEKHSEIMTKKGFPPVMNGRFGSNGAFAYLDTVSALKTIWEPVKMADEGYAPIVRIPQDESAVSPAKIKVNEIYQVSLAVKNIEETMANYWNILGIGPWEVFTAAPPIFHDRTYYGKPADHSFMFALTMLGPVEFELIQPVSGDSLYWDFICEHGEGISHLAFTVEDVAETTKIMEAEGFPAIQSGAYGDNSYAYYDTRGPLKIAWEAFRPPPTNPKPDFCYPK